MNQPDPPNPRNEQFIHEGEEITNFQTGEIFIIPRPATHLCHGSAAGASVWEKDAARGAAKARGYGLDELRWGPRRRGSTI